MVAMLRGKPHQINGIGIFYQIFYISHCLAATLSLHPIESKSL